MSGGFFRGTSADQDTRFSNKQAKLMKSQKFAPELENLVDMTKVKMDVMKPWIAKRVTELIGFEDEVLINFIYTLLEGKAVNGKNLQIQLTGFMERNTPKFMKELWVLLISAQQNASGVPQLFLDAKEEETKKKKAETDRVANEIRMKREKQDLDQMKSKMDGNGEAPGEKHYVKYDREQPTDEKERHKRNDSRGRNRVSHSSDSASRSPSPRRKRSESPNKSSNPRSYSNERRRSRSISGAPKSRSRSISSERRRRSSPRRSVTPRRRHTRRSPSPPRHRSLRHRSPSPTRHRVRPSWRYRSRSPLRRRSRSPIRRRSKTPIRRSPVRRRSPSPVRRRSRSPIRRRSPSPVRRRSPSPVRGRSPSPDRRRSPSPLRRRSPSPVVGQSLSPVRRRSLSPVQGRSISPVRGGSSTSRSTSPVRQRSPPPVRRSSPSPYRRRPQPQRRRSPARERMRRSPSTPPKLSTSPPPRRSSIHGRDRSLTPVRRRLPSDRSSNSPSPTHRHSLRRGSPRRIARSPLQSPGRRVRSREEYSPARRASPTETTELLSKSHIASKSVERKPVAVLRSPQRDVLDPKNLRRKDRHSSPSINTSRSGDQRSTSPHGSPYARRDRKSHPESLSSISKAVESKPRRDETGTRVDDKDNFSRREIGEPKRSSSGKVSPTSVRRKDSIDSAETHGIADATMSRMTELTRSDKQADRLDRKDYNERKGLSTIHEEADVSKKGREQSDRYKVTEKKSEKNGEMDSTPIKIDDPAIKGKEKRKHRKSDDYSSEDSHEERREAKKRKKEEKKLKKEERRRRREERRRKKEEKRKLKKSVDSGSSSSDFERDHSEDDNVRRRDLRKNTQDTESQQKKLEIELREKALESLRAKRGIGN